MRRHLLLTVAFFVIAAIIPSVAAPPSAATDRAIVHLLNRTAYGPRPGDVEKVRAIGIERYIDQQLHPERIPDTAMSARLSGLTTIGMSSREIAERYALPAIEAKRERKQDAKVRGAGDPGGRDNGAKPPPAKDPEQEQARR